MHIHTFGAIDRRKGLTIGFSNMHTCTYHTFGAIGIDRRKGLIIGLSMLGWILRQKTSCAKEHAKL